MKSIHKFARLLSLVLAIGTLFALAAPALAAAGDVGATISVNGTSSNSTGTTASDSYDVAAASGYGVVNISAYVYEAPGTSSKKIVMLSKNIQVTYTGESGSFYQISYTNASGKTYTGFMEKSKLKNVDASAAQSNSAAGSVKQGSSQPSANIASALAEAQKKNSDVIGYISINGTNISRPIMHRAGDVHYYSSKNIDKNKDSAGEVYSFYNALYRNNTITGHNMRGSNRLFHQLHHLQEKALGYNTCQHSKCVSKDLSNVPDIRQSANRVWDINFKGYNKWEVWAMYEVKANEPKETLNYNVHPLGSTQQTEEWIAKQKSRTEIDFGVSVSAQDTFITIYTCGTNYDSSKAQSRLYFFLKAVS